MDWTERWIQGLLLMHVVLWLLVLVFRKNLTFQGVLFVLISVTVRAAEYINTLLRDKYWKSFARQNYFDERGVFAVIMFAGPLIALAMVQVVSLPYPMHARSSSSSSCLFPSVEPQRKGLVVVMGSPQKHAYLTIMCLCCCQCIFLTTAAHMLVTVKRAELARKKSKKE